MATLLTGEGEGENPLARRLLVSALAHTYGCWDRLRGEDPYACARRYLVVRFAHAGRRYRAAHPDAPLAALTPQERLVLVLRYYEGVDVEQIAALLGCSTDRARALCHRAGTRLLDASRTPPRSPG